MSNKSGKSPYVVCQAAFVNCKKIVEFEWLKSILHVIFHFSPLPDRLAAVLDTGKSH